MIKIYETQPDFTNESDVKFWMDKSCNNYVKKLGLKNVICFLVETPDGCRTRLITLNGMPHYENQNLEAIGCHLDMMAVCEKFDGKIDHTDLG